MKKNKKTPPPFLTRVWYNYLVRNSLLLASSKAVLVSVISAQLTIASATSLSSFSVLEVLMSHSQRLFRFIYYHLLTVKVLISKLDYSIPALLNYIPSFFSQCLRTVYGYLTPKRERKNLVKPPFLGLCLVGENIVANFAEKR